MSPLLKSHSRSGPTTSSKTLLINLKWWTSLTLRRICDWAFESIRNVTRTSNSSEFLPSLRKVPLGVSLEQSCTQIRFLEYLKKIPYIIMSVVALHQVPRPWLRRFKNTIKIVRYMAFWCFILFFRRSSGTIGEYTCTERQGFILKQMMTGYVTRSIPAKMSKDCATPTTVGAFSVSAPPRDENNATRTSRARHKQSVEYWIDIACRKHSRIVVSPMKQGGLAVQ